MNNTLEEGMYDPVASCTLLHNRMLTLWQSSHGKAGSLSLTFLAKCDFAGIRWLSAVKAWVR